MPCWAVSRLHTQGVIMEFQILLSGVFLGAVATFAGFLIAFKRKAAKPTGKSAKFLSLLGG